MYSRISLLIMNSGKANAPLTILESSLIRTGIHKSFFYVLEDRKVLMDLNLKSPLFRCGKLPGALGVSFQLPYHFSIAVEGGQTLPVSDFHKALASEQINLTKNDVCSYHMKLSVSSSRYWSVSLGNLQMRGVATKAHQHITC